MPDFTLKIYKQLLAALRDAGYRFITFEEYMRETEDGSPKSEDRRPKTEEKSRKSKVDKNVLDQDEGNFSKTDPSPFRSPFVILRHDIDLLPQNALAFARIQHEMGISGSYYFRAVPESWDEKIIKEIHSMGHEVGYHYEDMDDVNSEKFKVETAKSAREKRKEHKETHAPFASPSRSLRLKNKHQQTRVSPVTGLGSASPHPEHIDAAILSFQHNLEKLRRLVPVNTICMHGSPRSRYDNRDLWKIYDYRDFGILGEPYFDVDFNEMFYLTDTGRRWDGWKVSVRDKVPQQETWIKQGLVFRSTHDIIAALETTKPERDERDERKETPVNLAPPSHSVRLKKQPLLLPTSIMFTFHPQRWTDKPLPWFKEWVMQSVKNKVKYFINLRREK